MVSKHESKQISDEYIVEAYGEALLKLGPQRPDMIVIDADLSSDCRIRKFENTFNNQFIENGIAEQDMVSMAGGLAHFGLLPVVNSFASFLASRANEQIYNNATELSKIIYTCHYGGLIPAGPGKSHQSIRDISLFGALPNMTIVQPCNAKETEEIVNYCVQESRENCMIRLNIGPSPRRLELPTSHKTEYGKGAMLRTGMDAVIFGYGPIMLYEAVLASEILEEQGFGLQVINMPWLNKVDIEWFKSIIQTQNKIFIIEDHAPVGGLGDYLLNVLVENNLLKDKHFEKFAIEGYPACGTPQEALCFHRLDGKSIAGRINKN